MSEIERAELGAQIETRRKRKYGTKRAAYAAAKVNAATWDKAEAGESVREDLLRQIVRTLWPETEGDWTELGVADSPGIEARVAHLERIVATLVPRPEPPGPPDAKGVRSDETA